MIFSCTSFVLYFFDIDLDLSYLFPYVHNIFGTIIKENAFVMLEFHLIIHQMESEPSLWNLLT